MSTLKTLVGQVLDDKYRIEKQLGQGGMGAVFLATHIGTGRPVALKVISPQLMTNEEFVERFKREARAAGLLRHPNVVNVTDFGFTYVGTTRIAYLVMEYLNGSSLGDLMKQRGKLPLNFVVDTIEQVCLALAEAHRNGIIHRDLKPDNIWLEPTGRSGYNVKVLDFGLAKLKSNEPPANNSAAATDRASALTIPYIHNISEAVTAVHPSQSNDEEKTRVITETNRSQEQENRLTSVGTILGTPLYMSPEQCSGKELDTGSDIYSLGVLVYEMLAGEPPFTGNLYTLMVKHNEVAPPPLVDKRPDISRAVLNLVMTALAKNPDDRPVSAEAFANSLRVASEDESISFRQAIAIYNEAPRTFILLFLLAYALPTISLGAFLPTLTYVIPKGEFSILVSIFLLFFILCASFSFTNLVVGGVFVPIVIQRLISPLAPINLREIFSNAVVKLWDYLMTSLIAYRSATVSMTLYALNPFLINVTEWFNPLLAILLPYLFILFDYRRIRNSQFFAPVLFVEKKVGTAALERSALLVKNQSLLSSSNRILSLAYIGGFAAIALMATSSWLLIKTLNDGLLLENTPLWIAYHILGVLLSLLVIVSIGPIIPIVHAQAYLKACRAGGQSLKDLTTETQR